jgi:hypothetical protein
LNCQNVAKHTEVSISFQSCKALFEKPCIKIHFWLLLLPAAAPTHGCWLLCTPTTMSSNAIVQQRPPVRITLDQNQLENVKYFYYMRCPITNDERCAREIKSRIAMAKAAFNKMTSHQQN